MDRQVKEILATILGTFLLVQPLDAENKKIDKEGAQKHLSMGYQWLIQGNTLNAIEEFRIAIELDPTNPDPVAGMADAYFAMTEFNRAINYYKKALDMNPSSAMLNRNLGMAYSYSGDNDLAVKYWKKAGELDNQMPMLHYNIGVYYMKKEDYKRAKEEFLAEIKINPRDAPSYFNLMVCYGMLNNEDEMRKAYERYKETEDDPIRLNENKEKMDTLLKVLDRQKREKPAEK